MVETFYKTIKSELTWPVAWPSRQQADSAVARDICELQNPVGDIHRLATTAPSHSSDGQGK